MANIITKAKNYIIQGLVLAGLIVGGVVLLNQPDEQFLTVQEWRVLAEIYNEELQGGITLSNVGADANILDKLDEVILARAQSREIDDKNLIEGLLIKRNPKNKEIIKNLRQVE